MDYHFHARFTATARRYRYIIYNHPIRPGILHHRVSWYYYPLAVEKMQQAATYLLGEQNFTSFRSSKCGSKSPMRCIHACQVVRKGKYVIVEIEANAFLHHMVRNIAGVLLKIGADHQPPAWMGEVISAKNRRVAAETAAPQGLYLTAVRYPPHYALPLSEELVLF